MKPVSNVFIFLAVISQLFFMPVVSATEEAALAQSIADWLVTQTTQEAINQCNGAVNGQGNIAGLSTAELQAILNGQSCGTFITSIKAP